MNILLASSKYMPEYSGSGFRAHNLYKRLTVSHPEVNLTIVSGSVSENSSSVYEYDGFTVNRIAGKKYPALPENPFLRVYRSSRNFKAEFNMTVGFLEKLGNRPDAIHIFGQNYVTAAVLEYARKHRIKTLIELCNEMPTPHHYIPFPHKYFISGMPPEDYKFICISEKLHKVCSESGVPEEKIWTRPNPVDENIFKPVCRAEKLKLRRNLTPFGADDKVVAYIAKFRKSKNHRFLLEVLLKLPKEYKLVLGGPLVEYGPEKERCEKLYEEMESFIEDNNLRERVALFHGFVENMNEFYKLSDVYAFPTLEEGLGTPMLEAVACGVPVVANLIENVTDRWIRNGENGYVSETDADIFAENIVNASNFADERKVVESENILAVAGTSVIDKKYWELINE